MYQSVTIDEGILQNVVSLAVAALLTIPVNQKAAWLAAFTAAEEDLKRAGWFKLDGNSYVLCEHAERQPRIHVYKDGVHANCRPYSEGQPCRHLAALHLINLYVSALQLPTLAVRRVRSADTVPTFADGTVDVFAHRPAQPQGPARRQVFDGPQSLGGNW